MKCLLASILIVSKGVLRPAIPFLPQYEFLSSVIALKTFLVIHHKEMPINQAALTSSMLPTCLHSNPIHLGIIPQKNNITKFRHFDHF